MKQCFFLLLMLSKLAIASSGYDGVWNGTGKAYDTDGWTGECTTLTIKVIQTESVFSIRDGFWHCGNKTTHWSPLDFDIGFLGNLYYEHVPVGKLSGTSLVMRLPEESSLLNHHAVGYYRVRKIADDAFVYKQRLGYGTYALYIDAVMRREK